MGGLITATNISGSLDAKNIAMSVLTRQLEVSDLAELALKTPVPELNATIPIYIPGEADEDLGEWATTEFNGGSFTNVDFNLKKDRVKLGVSTEARYRSGSGDPMAIQINAQAMVLANKLDKKIVKALETSPQTGSTSGAWSTVTNNPLRDFAKAVAAIRPWKADYAIMPSPVWSAFVGNDYTHKFVEGAPEKMGGVITTIPGLNLKVYVNDNVTAKSVIVGCSGAPSVALGQGPVEVADEKIGTNGRVYTMDVFRQAVAPIMKNASSKNVAVYQVTGVIA